MFLESNYIFSYNFVYQFKQFLLCNYNPYFYTAAKTLYVIVREIKFILI